MLRLKLEKREKSKSLDKSMKIDSHKCQKEENAKVSVKCGLLTAEKRRNMENVFYRTSKTAA